MSDTKRQPKSGTLDDLERHMEQRRLERAVIEAARGWRDSDQAAAECAILLQTLAALDEAEGR